MSAHQGRPDIDLDRAEVRRWTQLGERQASWQRIGGESPVAASKAADLGGEKPLPSIARFRTASISDARGGDKPRCART